MKGLAPGDMLLECRAGLKPPGDSDLLIILSCFLLNSKQRRVAGAWNFIVKLSAIEKYLYRLENIKISRNPKYVGLLSFTDEVFLHFPCSNVLFQLIGTCIAPVLFLLLNRTTGSLKFT